MFPIVFNLFVEVGSLLCQILFTIILFSGQDLSRCHSH